MTDLDVEGIAGLADVELEQKIDWVTGMAEQELERMTTLAAQIL
jgi:hypothetical protein